MNARSENGDHDKVVCLPWSPLKGKVEEEEEEGKESVSSRSASNSNTLPIWVCGPKFTATYVMTFSSSSSTNQRFRPLPTLSACSEKGSERGGRKKIHNKVKVALSLLRVCGRGGDEHEMRNLKPARR